MAKRKPVKSEGRLKDGLTWRLSDPGMGLLERAGLATLYMSLRAAEEQGAKDDLAPLTWNDADLTPDSVTLRSTADDKSALLNLFKWAWQVRDGVLYLPAVHRNVVSRDNFHLRLSSHNGICRTFLQHPRVQPKGDVIDRLVEPDEGQQRAVRYQSLGNQILKPIGDLEKSKFFDQDGSLSPKAVSLSGWVFPGIAPRFANEGAWDGSAEIGLLLMLAPIACLFQQMYNEKGTWLFIVPDVRDLEDFDIGRNAPMVYGDPKWIDVASLSDAGLRFLSIFQTRRARQELQSGCQVVAMGKVGYYQSQSIRKGIVDVDAGAQILRRYRLLEARLGNRWMRRKADKDSSRPSKSKEAAAEKPTASGFISVPTVRGRIADNLILGNPWYAELASPLAWDLAALERQRKRRSGASIERLWFNNLSYQRRSLVELIHEDEMWDNPAEREFVEAFWEVLGALYFREKEAVDRGGSRTWGDRIEDLNEDIRRSLTRAKTGPLLRETIAELFARPVEKYRSPHVRRNPALIWKLIDRDWKCGRDLALLALASYQSKDKRAGKNSETP